MEKMQVTINDQGTGEIELYSEDIKAGKVEISVKENLLTVYHTEVEEAYGGKGFAKLLLNELVSYASANGLQILPLCPYVYAQFKRHPVDYQGIWFHPDQE